MILSFAFHSTLYLLALALIFSIFEFLAPRNGAAGEIGFRAITAEKIFYWFLIGILGNPLYSLWLADLFRSVETTQVRATNILIFLVTMDLGYYLVHRFIFHKWLWFAHKLHHSEAEPTWLSFARCHPLETFVITAVRAASIFVSGLNMNELYGLIFFEIIVSAYSHSNISFKPRGWSRFILTPAYHRIHHGTGERELSTNFTGNFFLLTDILFKTQNLDFLKLKSSGKM